MKRLPSPVFPPDPTTWSRIKTIAQGVFSVIGIAVTLYAAYGIVVPPSDVQRVLYVVVDQPLFSRPPEFPTGVTVAGVDAGDQDLTETYLTLWRDGGKPITTEMTRRPLHVALPSGSHLAAYKVMRADSSVPDNFAVERAGDDLLIRWKVWDPDMALKIVVVRSGFASNLTLSGEVGPGVAVDRIWALLRLRSGSIVSVSVLLLVLMGLLASLFPDPSVWERRFPSPRVRAAVVMFLAVTITVATMIEIENDAQFSAWLSSRFVKPIPFTDAK